jgi:hypothetical protein
MPISYNDNPGQIIFDVGTASTSSIHYTTTANYSSPSGMRADVKYGADKGKPLSPKIYFRYLKSRLTKTDKTALKGRLDNLAAMINSAKENDQAALYETLSAKLVSLLLESEAEAIGCDKYIERSTIEKYKDQVRTDEASVVLDTLEEFPRILPPDVQSTLRSLKTKKVFNEFFILHLSYKTGKIKTNKDKIREKDPILLGVFTDDLDRFYFIADWVDEYCDLTLDKLVDEMKTADFDPVHTVPKMDEKYFEDIKKEVRDRAKRLKETNRGNYHQLMEKEDKLRQLRNKAKSISKKVVDYYRKKSPVVRFISKVCGLK